MAIADEIIKLLDEFGDKTKNDLIASIDSKTTVKTRLGASIKFEYMNLSGGLRFVLKLNDYYEIVDKGRNGVGGTNRNPNSKIDWGSSGKVSKEGQESIMKWAQTRGIVEKLRVKDLQTRLAKQANNKTKRPKKALKKKDFQKFSKGVAYVIARNIERRGYEGNNWFTDIVEDGRIEELQNKLTELIGDNFEIEIQK